MFMFVVESCSPAKGTEPGHEYMPDMVHSIAYEANLYDYYSYNRWGGDSTYYRYALARTPVKGTMAVGEYGLMQKTTIEQADLRHTLAMYPLSGADHYAYANTEPDRLRAEAELSNPLTITTDGLAQGQLLYDINCAICHGPKADGAGYLVRDDGGMYPAAPANLISDPFIAAKDGRFYHAIIYGKNVMGGYGDKMSLTERWEVIHYIRSLQAGAKGLKYDQTANTLDRMHKPAQGMATGQNAVAVAPAAVDTAKVAMKK